MTITLSLLVLSVAPVVVLNFLFASICSIRVCDIMSFFFLGFIFICFVAYFYLMMWYRSVSLLKAKSYDDYYPILINLLKNSFFFFCACFHNKDWHVNPTDFPKITLNEFQPKNSKEEYTVNVQFCHIAGGSIRHNEIEIYNKTNGRK